MLKKIRRNHLEKGNLKVVFALNPVIDILDWIQGNISFTDMIENIQGNF